MCSKIKLLFVVFVALAASLSLTSCYTQLARYDIEQERNGEVYADNPSYEEDEEVIEEATPDTIIIHKHGATVHTHWPVLYDVWWYEPYWYYGGYDWWRWHHRWDPWYGYSGFWGDPFFWPSFSYYGGWGYYGSYWGWGYGYGPDWYRPGNEYWGNYGRRHFDRRGISPRAFDNRGSLVHHPGAVEAKSSATEDRTMVPRRSDGTVSRSQSDTKSSTGQPAVKRSTPTRRTNDDNKTIERRSTPSRRSSDQNVRRSSGSSDSSSKSGVRENTRRSSSSSSSSSGTNRSSSSSSGRSTVSRSGSSGSSSSSSSSGSSSSGGGGSSRSSGSSSGGRRR
ncbi:MAG TPA: hypothetical protein PK843_02830 [bacterium]|nr:hypothetical protein [bacterium]